MNLDDYRIPTHAGSASVGDLRAITASANALRKLVADALGTLSTVEDHGNRIGGRIVLSRYLLDSVGERHRAEILARQVEQALRAIDKRMTDEGVHPADDLIDIRVEVRAFA